MTAVVSVSFENVGLAAVPVALKDNSEADVVAPQYKPRNCRFCDEPIPQKRMIATKGSATACVPCQEANGDVPLVKMFTESSEEGTISTVYTDSNPYLQKQEQRRAALGHLSPLTFLIAAGDDAHLRKPRLRDNIGSERIDYDTEERINRKIDSERK